MYLTAGLVDASEQEDLREQVKRYKLEAASEKKKQRSLRRTMQRIVNAAKNEEPVIIKVKVID